MEENVDLSVTKFNLKMHKYVEMADTDMTKLSLLVQEITKEGENEAGPDIEKFGDILDQLADLFGKAARRNLMMEDTINTLSYDMKEVYYGGFVEGED